MNHPSVTIELSYPPSVNHYYRHVGPRVLISREGRLYRDRVAARLFERGVQKRHGRVALEIQAYPPDERRRDLDNLLKSLFDALAYGGLYDDDSNVKKLQIEMLDSMPPDGMIVVRARTI